VGRPRLDMSTNMTLTRSKVKIKVTELLKFRKLHYSRSISSTILACSSKPMADYNNMGLSQLVYSLSESHLRISFSSDFKLRVMSTLQDFQRAIFPYCLSLESHGRVCHGATAPLVHGYARSPMCIVHADMTLTRSNHQPLFVQLRDQVC